jgi:hypothetical protein
VPQIKVAPAPQKSDAPQIKVQPPQKRDPPQIKLEPPPKVEPAPKADAPVVVVPPISEEHWRAVLFMNEEVRADAPLAETIANPRLGLRLREGAPIRGPFRPPGTVTLETDPRLASFLLEGLWPDLPEAQQNCPIKLFPEPKVIGLRLPVTLPVCVSTRRNHTALGFFDTARVSAQETRALVEGVLESLAAREVVVARFVGVDARSFAASVRYFATEWDIYLVFSVDAINQQNETQDVTVRILKSHWEPGLDERIRAALLELFDNMAVRTCANCKLLFSKGDGPSCVTYRHPGHRLPVERGEMEITEIDDEEDDVLTIVKWSCCGEQPIDYPGCEIVGKGPHVADLQRPPEPTIDFRLSTILE